MTRIALALEYPLMQQGGTEVLVQELIRGLSRHFELVLVSGDRSREELDPEFSRLIRAHVPWQRWPVTRTAAARLDAELRQQKVQLAHFHFGGTYAWQSHRLWRCPIYRFARTNIPCIATNHLAVEWLDSGLEPDRPVWQRFLYQLFALACRSLVYMRLKLEICVSQHDRARVLRSFPLFRHKIIQLYHSLLSAEGPGPILSGRAPVVLCVGTIGGRKAQPILVEAFCRVASKHPAWRLELVGRPADAGDVARIKETIARHGLADRVRLAGRLSDEETIALMKTASIFAMPSLQEGLGLSLQEAIYHGCVAVGTRAGGIPELIDDGHNGLLVPPGDPAALSAALDRLMSNPALLDKFREAARPSILRKGMTTDAMLRNYLEIYRRFLPPGAA